MPRYFLILTTNVTECINYEHKLNTYRKDENNTDPCRISAVSAHAFCQWLWVSLDQGRPGTMHTKTPILPHSKISNRNAKNVATKSFAAIKNIYLWGAAARCIKYTIYSLAEKVIAFGPAYKAHYLKSANCFGTRYAILPYHIATIPWNIFVCWLSLNLQQGRTRCTRPLKVNSALRLSMSDNSQWRNVTHRLQSPKFDCIKYLINAKLE